MPMSIAVLADDLTGAADTAVAFARPGRPVPVLFRPAPVPIPVFAVDLDVRDAPVDLDVRAAYAAQAARVPAGHAVYVKIDSTLRGRIGDALAGVLDALPGRPLICAPGFPTVGRSVHGSVVHVHGVPLHRSPIWHAAADAAPRSLLEVVPSPPTATLSVAAVRSGGVEAALEASGPTPVLVCDTADATDLAHIACAGSAHDRPPVWVGSAGLAHALAALEHGADDDRRRPADDDPWPARFLAVIGSASAPSHAQVELLAAAGASWFPVSAHHLLAASTSALAGRAHAIAAAASAGPVVVSLEPGPADPGITDHLGRARLTRALAELVAPATEVTQMLVLSGGATARAVLTAVGITSLAVEREPLPGVVASRAGGGRTLRIVTKAGAFGDEHTLIDLLYPSSHRIGAL